MKLQIKETAPEFELPSWDGSTIKLSEHLGHPTWVAFFRYASCPLCNLRIHEMIQRYPIWRELGLSILAVFQSPPESMARYVGKQAPPFSLLCDPGEKIYHRYGLGRSLAGFASPSNIAPMGAAMRLGFRPGKMEGTKTRLPADFLISSDGVIQAVFYGSTISDHISYKEIDAFLN